MKRIISLRPAEDESDCFEVIIADGSEWRTKA